MAWKLTTDRLIAGVLGRCKLLVDRFYVERHPGRLERALIRFAAPVVRRMAPNDRWSLPVHAVSWMSVVQAPPALPREQPRRILIFCLYRGQFSIDLPFAALLAWRGHHVTFAYIPKLRSPIKSPLADHPSAKEYLKSALFGVAYASGGRISVVDLTEFEDLEAPIDEPFLQRQTMSDCVMRLQRESIDASSSEDAESLAYYRDSGAAAQKMAWGFLSERRGDFDLAIVGNGTTFEPANVCNVLRRCGIPLNTYEKFAFRNVRVMNHGDDFRSFHDLDLVWDRRIELGYTGAFRDFAAAKARTLVDARRRSSTATWAWALQRSPEQDTDDALRDAGVDALKPFILICTNVPYDAGYDKLCRIFPSMREWLVHTVRLLLDRTDLQVVVRAHPGESAHYGGHERSEDNLAAAGLLPGPRLIVIPGAKPTNTYGLMERCKFGVVFSSTTGLEMAMTGKRVVIGADVYYGRRGFTVDVEDKDDYDERILELACAAVEPKLSKAQADDAALFHFLLHYAMQWPYPWHKGGEAGAVTPNKLVRSGNILRYLPMIDALATPQAEFQKHLGRYLSVAQCCHLPKPDLMPAGRGAL